MEDLEKWVEKLNSIKRFNFIFGIFIVLITMGLAIWVYPQADTKGEVTLLIYISLNMLITLVISIKFLKVIPKDKFKGDPVDYNMAQVGRAIIASEISPFTLFFPLIFGSIGIWVIDYSNDKRAIHEIYIVLFLMLSFGIYRWWITRKKIRRLYKKIHHSDFFSFFHF